MQYDLLYFGDTVYLLAFPIYDANQFIASELTDVMLPY